MTREIYEKLSKYSIKLIRSDMRFLIVTSIYLTLIVPPMSGSAQSFSTTRQGIIAVVNDDIISQFDFSDRIKLVILTSGLPNNENTAKRISAQILRGLINDKLKLQEAKRLGIKVSQAELTAAIVKIEKTNGLSKGKMRELLEKRSINFRTFEHQVEAQTAWNKAVVRKVLSTKKISEEDIDNAIAEIELNKGKPEYNVSEIFIPFYYNKSAKKTNQIAMRMYSQIQRGANFAALARAFSQSATAARGGNLGWIRSDQIQQNFSGIISKMKINTTSVPLEGDDGYYILKLLDKRTSRGVTIEKARITLQQLFLPLRINPSRKEVESAANRANRISSNTKNCSSLNLKGQEVGSRQSGRLEVDDISQLPNNIKTIVQNIDLSKASRPIRMRTGFLIVMVCKRSASTFNKNIRTKIKNMLLEQRAIITDRSMLRKIRRAAFLNIRR